MDSIIIKSEIVENDSDFLGYGKSGASIRAIVYEHIKDLQPGQIDILTVTDEEMARKIQQRIAAVADRLGWKRAGGGHSFKSRINGTVVKIKRI